MTYPQFPPPAAPQPQYAPPVPQFQQQPQPAYPPVYPPPQYAQPVPQFQQPQYAAPQQQLAQGSLSDFYDAPSTGGGKSLTFDTPGTRYIGIVSRPLGNGDVQQQTNTQGVPQFYKDNRPKWVMRVPLQMQPHPVYPDGVATWYVKGAARDELNRAMAAAGCDDAIIKAGPEAGSIVDVTFTTTRPSGPGMNPAKLFSVGYTRPNGVQSAAPAAAAAVAAPAPAVFAEIQQVAAPQMAAPLMDPAYAASLAAIQQQAPVAQPLPVPQPQQMQLPLPTAAPAMAVPAPAPAPATAAPQLTTEQQELLAQLTGGAPAQ